LGYRRYILAPDKIEKGQKLDEKTDFNNNRIIFHNELECTVYKKIPGMGIQNPHGQHIAGTAQGKV
jgi:hypothetical protein